VWEITSNFVTSVGKLLFPTPVTMFRVIFYSSDKVTCYFPHEWQRYLLLLFTTPETNCLVESEWSHYWRSIGNKLANILNFGFHIATSLLHKFQQSHLQYKVMEEITQARIQMLMQNRRIRGVTATTNHSFSIAISIINI
jgi:hypothetical protein